MNRPESKKISSKREWIRLGIKLVILALIFWIVLGVLFGIRRVEGVAMAPKVTDGDLSLFYRSNKDISIGDVVLFTKNGKRYISRVVAAENDIISLDEEGHLYVNGDEISDSPAYDVSQGNSITISYPQRVRTGAFFVVNDNLNSEDDSRSFGIIGRDDIYGKIISILRTRGI